MKVELSGATPLEVDAAFLAVPAFEEEMAEAGKGLVGEIDRRIGGHFAAAARDEDFGGKAGQSLLLNGLGKLKAARVMLLGLGKRDAAAEALPRSGHEALRMAAGKAARAAWKAGASRMAMAAPRLPGTAAGAARAIVEGALLGAYRFDRYKSEKKHPHAPQALAVLLPQGQERSREVRDAASLAHAVADAVAWARDLVNEPPLACTPVRLAHAARDLAREAGLACELHGPREIASLRMGLFLGVTRGSAEEPRLVKVSWVPRGPAGKRAPLVLVGKAITFDSGGVPFGTATPFTEPQVATSMPCSLRVGTLGRVASRWLRATPIARKRPVLRCGSTSEGWPPPMVRWPPARAVVASAPPANGTVVMGMFARLAIARMTRSTEPAAVETAAVILFPFFAHSTRSFIDLMGDFPLTQMTIEWIEILATGAMSFKGSKGIFCRCGMTKSWPEPCPT
jgi:hypothetical protein